MLERKNKEEDRSAKSSYFQQIRVETFYKNGIAEQRDKGSRRKTAVLSQQVF